MDEKTKKLNKIFTVINEFEEYFSEEFEKTNIKKCDKCTNGLKNQYNITDNFCEYCGGIGYVGIEKMKGEFICRRCMGGGCKFCSYKGTVDWVTNLMGKDIPSSQRDYYDRYI